MVKDVKQSNKGRASNDAPRPAESEQVPRRPNACVSYFELQGQQYAVVSRAIETVTTALTTAEIAVANLVAAGHSNERIAELRGRRHEPLPIRSRRSCESSMCLLGTTLRASWGRPEMFVRGASRFACADVLVSDGPFCQLLIETFAYEK